MNKLNIEGFVDQRKISSHIFYVLITFILVVVVSIKSGRVLSFSEKAGYFILGLVQVEVFIFAARMIFKTPEAKINRREFTRLILLRFVVFISVCFVAAFIIILIYKIGSGIVYNQNIRSVFSTFFEQEFSSWFRATLGGLSIGAVIFIIIQWQDALKREQKLREENLVFQNETLKSQVNPHFLFNSLNTVSSLIQSDPAKADQFVNSLSSLYRYILENSHKDKVPLQSELDLVNRYYDLHRVRDEEKIILSIDYSEIRDYQILPVSLQILIENAIKHNLATRENPLKILIYFEDGYVAVRNNLQKKATSLKSTGTGLKNLAERISLITGKELIIDETADFFTVKLPLVK